jgi:hypothetical protein
VKQPDWLDVTLERTRDQVHAPRGFAQRVMESVYRESLAGSPAAVEGGAARQYPSVSRLYRRLGLSLMVTAAVLATSLLVPHGAYTSLIRGSAQAALGDGPSAAVQKVILGAGHAVQGTLGEQQIGGTQE